MLTNLLTYYTARSPLGICGLKMVIDMRENPAPD